MGADNEILLEDMEEIADNTVLADGLADSTVFVTGATGLIGSQAVLAMLCMNKKRNSNIHVIAMIRSEEKAKKVFGDWLFDEHLTLYHGDINEPIGYTEKVDYVIHGASATSSKYFVTYPVETIMTAIDGTKNILEFARSKDLKGMVYLSSLEVYGTPDKGQGYIKENDSGYIDSMSVRSSYSEGKRLVECMCASYQKEYHIPVKVARLSQTFGAGVEYDDGRVFAEFARCAVEKKDIILHTQGNTIRSYCYTKDAVTALFYILLQGEVGEAYNVTNMDTAVSIREMAELVCSLYPQNGICTRIEVPEDMASFGYNPEMVIRLDSSKLQALGWRATVGLKDMFLRMIQSSFQK